MVQFQTNTVTGCMAFSGMRHRALATGHAGMELQPSNCASEDCFIMNRLTVVIGLRWVKFLNCEEILIYFLIFFSLCKITQNVEGCQKHREYYIKKFQYLNEHVRRG